jgi:anti-sigma factor RsiW
VNVPHDPRDPRLRHGVHAPEELGAHVLGLLDPTQSRAVEEHLAGCPACRREWEELRGMVNLLDDVPPEAFLDGPPDADLMLRRTLPRAGLAVLPRSGHLTNLEEPALFNRLVGDFIAAAEHDAWGLRDPRSLAASTTGMSD